ncbi:DUF7345 domain-containing protein [Halalkalicoccus tibetensis]|uniref:Helix-turn-helix domain-containing protein n=1 Tax=Halalkalicoccus tibetensis TaxID=175632 RepID=A0ABD5V256_9EURY
MRMSAVVVLGLCLVVAIGGLAFGAESAAGQSNGVESEVENGSQTIEIWLDEDGHADVSVYKQFGLETAEDEEAFDRLAEDFEDGEADGELSAETYERVAAGASEETDREMTIEDVERETEATSNTGTLRLNFVWNGFADATDERVEVGDAFVIDGETWLPALSDDQRLVIHTPEGYAIDSADEASIDDGTLVWEGPQSFDPGEFEATLVRSEPSEDGFSLLTVGLGLGLVATIVLLVYVLSRREGDESFVPAPTGGGRGWMALLTPAARTDDGSATHDPEPDPDREPAIEPEPDPDPLADVDEDLLSDEERVLRLLAANDGRMKQASIVVETDWSNAKVSQLLSAMEEEGEIEKLRIGRENLITLADREG